MYFRAEHDRMYDRLTVGLLNENLSDFVRLLNQSEQLQARIGPLKKLVFFEKNRMKNQ